VVGHARPDLWHVAGQEPGVSPGALSCRG